MSKIPKIIHYCWFGPAEYSEKVKYCMASWEKKLHGYKLVLWNEENFDFDECVFAREAYEAKKYAFVSDFVRIWALEKYGGIYLDTDIEVLKDFDELLDNPAVFGTDDYGYITAFMASEAHNQIFTELLSLYKEMNFINPDGTYNMEVNNTWIQKSLTKYGYEIKNCMQILDNGTIIYPCEYFHAKSLGSGKEYVTNNTYCIHHHTLLWVTNKTRIIRFLRMHVLIPILGEEKYFELIKMIRGQ